ncbi:MAG: DUF938 domain-containing protein [Proteobacteria bacterium]|nr:DUF938 domain-containing protein [Pseudomonadota bacterium]
MKPYSDSCERNRQPILDVLVAEFSDITKVLEIGSGTGQHAAFFAPRLRQLVWQTSDLAENHADIRCWIEDVEEITLPTPLELDVSSERWPDTGADAVFSANTAHIMHWDRVCAMVAGVGRQFSSLDRGRFCLYGPFNENGEFSSASNRKFDAWLKQRDPSMGLRDLAEMARIAGEAGLALARRHRMPANNLLLVFDKVETTDAR